eukprot:720172-Karenia_brevis.AAC.1
MKEDQVGVAKYLSQRASGELWLETVASMFDTLYDWYVLKRLGFVIDALYDIRDPKFDESPACAELRDRSHMHVQAVHAL